MTLWVIRSTTPGPAREYYGREIAQGELGWTASLDNATAFADATHAHALVATYLGAQAHCEVVPLRPLLATRRLLQSAEALGPL